MVTNRWLSKRKAHWERLEELLKRAAGGLNRLSDAELQELGLLYRQTASDLSFVLEDASTAQIAAYLNQLLGRSHNLLYAGHKPDRRRFWRFFREEYPRIFRETLPLTLTAIAIFLVGAVAGWAVTLSDPGFPHRMLGARMMDTIAKRKMWTDSVVAIKPIASSAITTNNLSVAFSTFALGVTGAGTLYMLLFNGLLIGVIGAATWQAGMALSLWSFVAPHGVLELPAIFIAGGAGLELARGLLFPGFLPRKDSFAAAGRRAARLLLGVIPLLLIAGTIEGFFSPTNAPPFMKFVLGGVLFAALLLYLFGTGRNIRAPIAERDMLNTR